MEDRVVGGEALLHQRQEGAQLQDGRFQGVGFREKGGMAAPNQPVTPICQGTNSWSPRPSSSLLVFSPEAVRRISSKICLAHLLQRGRAVEDRRRS